MINDPNQGDASDRIARLRQLIEQTTNLLGELKDELEALSVQILGDQ